MIANKSNKAIVLIATIATLAVISVIVMFFAQSSMFERRIASNDNLERQAKLVATASIEWAASYIPKLAMGADEGDSEVKSKAYSSVADFYQFKVKKNENNKFERYDPHCPVEEYYLDSNNPYGKDTDNYKGNPSFYYERDPENRKGDEDISLPYEYSYRQNFDTNMVSLPTLHNPSEKLNDDTVSKGKPRWTVHSTLKCVDANAFWNINSPITNNEHDTNADYKNMVETLVSVVLGNNGEIVQKWVEERKKGEFADLGDFRKRMSSVKSLKQKDLDKLCRYITVDSWGNEKSFKYGKSYSEYENYAPFEKRYPININVASWEILTTVFANIEASNTSNTRGHAKIDQKVAEKLAKSIVEERYKNSQDKNNNNYPPFKTWNDVEKYLYDYNELSKDQAEAIFAVIYPGMLPHKKSPNKAQYRKFDKSDITVGTTECCLFSPGVFYCEAIGRVIEYNKKPYTVLAHSKVSVNMKLWEPYVVNSQSDFEWQRHKGDRTLATWSGIEGGYYPDPNDYPFQKDENKEEVSAGFLQERGFWDSGNSKYPDACRFWSWAEKDPGETKEKPHEKRVDGIYMKQDSDQGVVPGILEEAYNTKSETKKKWDDDEWKANKWQDDGFDLWIKPSYDDGDKADEPLKDPVLIAVKKEEAKTLNNYPCHILTRCAYDVDSEPYLTISRTLVINNPPGTFKKREGNNFRIFYNSTIIERVKEVSSVRKNLYLAGYKIFGLFLAYVQKLLYGSSARVDFTKSRRESSVIFSENFSNQVYRAIMQEDESVLIKDFVIYTKDHGQTNPYTIGLRVFLPFKGANITQDKERWCHSKIEKCEGTPNLFKSESDRDFVFIGDEGAVFILEYLFQQKDALPITQEITIPFDILPKDPLIYYGYVNRSSQQKEATELDWFPGKTDPDEPINIDVPIQTEYKYSRTESRIPITLYKGCWYHIHARWEDNKILLKDFKVHYKDGKTITFKRGELYKNLFGSPGRVWAIADDYNQEERSLYPRENNKTYFYCNNCVISFSHCYPRKEEEKEIWRYWSNTKSSIYTGNFNEGNSEDPSNEEYYNKFNLPKMWKSQKHPQYFYYGTVAWTQFFPKDKDNKTIKEAKFCINKNEKYKFYSWGEEENYPQNTIKPNSIFMKKYNNKDDDENAFFTFELKDNTEPNSSSHFETTIVDRVVLYMIVQPQPLHWSHNIYKDQK